MISAPSEIRCRVTPIIARKTKVMASTKGMVIVTTSPARTPSDTKQTASTMAMASTSACTKWPTDSSTTWGWSATLYNSIPSGIRAATRAISASSSSPKATTLAPSRMPTISPTAGCPL